MNTWVPNLVLLANLMIATPASADCYQPAARLDAPERIISINQFATENLLRLGLEDKLIATAYPDDDIDAELAPRLQGIPQLSLKWPSTELLVINKPDFLYVGFPSGFQTGVIGTEALWNQWGVSTLVSLPYCNPTNKPLQWDDLWRDLALLAEIFHRQPQLSALEQQARAQLPQADISRPWKMVHLEGNSQGFRVSAGLSAADLMIRLSGATNLASSLNQTWANWSAEQLLMANPEVISITDANFNDAERTMELLISHPVLSELDAVRHRRFIAIPFTDTVASPRLVKGVTRLTEAFHRFSPSKQVH